MEKSKETVDPASNKPKVPIIDRYQTPGPIYNVPSLMGEKGHDFRSNFPKAPAYTISLKYDTQKGAETPGPATYVPSCRQNYRGYDNSPKHTMSPLRNQNQIEKTPGPGQYNIFLADKVAWTRSPEHVIGHYLTKTVKNDNPAPNEYKITKLDLLSQSATSPKYTISHYLKYDKSKDEMPGPGKYNTVPMGLYLNSAPMITIAGVARQQDAGFLTPSPTHYKHELVTSNRPTSPAFTMGSIHSPFKGIFLEKPTEED